MVQLTITQKCEILKNIEQHKKIADIAKQFNVSVRNIHRIKNSKEKIENFAAKKYRKCNKIMRMRPSKVPNVEKALYTWFLNERLKMNSVTTESLMLKASEFHLSLDTEVVFSASKGWVEKFKKRHGIRLLTVCGEKLSANQSSIPDFHFIFKEKITELNLRPEQIYNADETVLLYKDLNNITPVGHSEEEPEMKNSKEYVTVMPCVNATGKHKLPLMVIGKSKNPRCFKNAVLPNLYYRSSRNACQTEELFTEWFKDVFIPEVTGHLKSCGLPIKALLILGNATCHPSNLSSDNFTVMFFPPNTTSILQPLDQNIIKSLKLSYRKKFFLHLLKQDGDIEDKLKKFNIREVLFLLCEAWESVRSSVVVNGWKALYKNNKNLLLNLPENHFDEELDNIPIARLYRQVIPRTSLTETEISDWVNGCNAFTTFEHMFTHDDSIQDANENVDSNQFSTETAHPAANLNLVISSFNTVIEWAANRSNVSLQDLLLLRKMSDVAVCEKYSNIE